MPSRHRRSTSRIRPISSFVLFAILLLTVGIAGGGSRGDVLGQVVVRTVAVLLLVVAVLRVESAALREVRPVLFFVLAALALALVQLAPLPPAVWSLLPGRSALADAVLISQAPGSWRPLSLVPEATLNAACSLLAPLAAVLLAADLGANGRSRLPGMLLVLILFVALVGLLQASGAGWQDPLVNGLPGQISGTFANRNHFALLLAVGCLLAPVWAFSARDRTRWHVPAAIGFMMLFFLTIMVSGSRAGLVLGGAALLLGPLIVLRKIRHVLDRQPRWVLPALAAGLVCAIAGLVLISFAVGRAFSLERVLIVDSGEDIRFRGRPVVLAMIQTYFPAGSGIGGFDPVFRMREPLGLLKQTYFNHAHNDWLEVLLDAGMLGGLLLGCAVVWWGVVSLRAWRAPDGALPKLGSAAILSIAVASIVDYPARTPMIMVVLVIAATWLNDARRDAGRSGAASALPGEGQHL